MKRLFNRNLRPAAAVGVAILTVIFSAWRVQAANDPETPESSAYLPVLIQIENDDVLDEIEAEGGEVWRRRGDLALVLLPAEKGDAEAMARVRSRRGVARMERARKAYPVMDVARTHFEASDVLEGRVDGTPYTGSGVVVGFCDVGFDPTHVNFLNEEGKTRVARFVIYDEYNGKREVLATHEEMSDRGTDFDDHFHATHVAGIMAGGGGRSPYKGVATDARIVATTSNLTDFGILCGLEDVIDYAHEEGLPAVVNMSLANHLGPHDGTSLFCRWIDLASEEAVIVISSGNSGAISSSLVHKFDEAATPVRVRVHTGDWMQFHVEGGVAAWSDDASPLTARLIIYDGTAGRELYSYPAVSSENGYWSVDSDSDEEMAKYFTGSVEIIGELDSASGRSVVTAWFATDTEVPSGSGNWARYTFALEVAGEAGHTVYVYSDGAGTRLTTYPGYTDANAQMSINDLATAKTAVTVGMYVNRDRVPLLGGGESVSPDATLSVNPRSSYGVLADGRVLPLTVAPGSNVVSSMSRYYLRRYPEAIGSCSYEELGATGDSKIGNEEPYRWIPYHGTSMSAPYVAGFIATWLQASPDLNSETIREIIETSNRHDYPNPADPHHGKGWFDPKAGLEQILARITVGLIPDTDDSGPRMSVSGTTVEICQPSGIESEMHVYDMSGRRIMARKITTVMESVEIPFGAGTYLLQLSETTGRYRPRTMKIRL
ncbi:MAG: S8 family serine peptidase [Bacteroides sp.]|nr:S8 family serine peptidase [Bacteroides sp.]